MQSLKNPWLIGNSIGLLVLVLAISEPFDFKLLFYDTILTGGDGASWYQIASHLKDSLLPNGRLFGWDQGNFFGYPNLQHYFVFPFFSAVLLSYILPLTVSLKIITLSGFFLMPFAVYWALRKMEYRNPIPLSGAWIMLAFMFHERYSMFGGNMLSTLAGEFCYSIAFTLMVIYLAMLFHDVKRQKLSLRTGALLGLVGLSHAFVFFVAVLMPLYFLLSKPKSMTVKIVFLNYLVGFLVMAFWALPMISNLGFTTPINLIWRFTDVIELLNGMLYEIVFVAIGIGSLFVFKKFRSTEGGFFCFGILISVFLYLVATALHIPDIRFFPPLLFFSIMLIIDSLSRFISFQKYYQDMVGVGILAISIIFGASWIYSENLQAPSWFSWNYSGYETKPAFVDGRATKLFDSLKGTYNDPRVAWEQGAHNSDFGAARVFENIPLFSGRASTEGIHYASGLLSLPITSLNGEYSITPSSPSANVYSHFFIDSLSERFHMLNIRDFIAYTPQITELIKETDEFEILTEQSPYTVFRWKNHNTQYVSTPMFKPFVVENYRDWKHRFNNWFRRGENLDITLVNSVFFNANFEGNYFTEPRIELDASGILKNLPRIPLEAAKISNERIENFKMSFDTNKPGMPHIVKVAYSPNWKSDNSEPIFMIAPGFMMIYPKTSHVELNYQRLWIEYLGIGLSLFGILFMLYFSVYKKKLYALMERPILNSMFSLMGTIRRPILIILGLVFLLASIWSYKEKQAIYVDHKAGINFMMAGELEKALDHFKKNATMENILHLDNVDVPTSLYNVARTYRDLGKNELARTEFEKLVKYYPRWSYIDEIYWHMGTIAYDQNRFEEARVLFERCIAIDRYGANAERCRFGLKSLP